MKSGHVSICEIEVSKKLLKLMIKSSFVTFINVSHYKKQLPNSNYRSIDIKTEQPIKHNQYIYTILVIQNYQKS